MLNSYLIGLAQFVKMMNNNNLGQYEYDDYFYIPNMNIVLITSLHLIFIIVTP